MRDDPDTAVKICRRFIFEQKISRTSSFIFSQPPYEHTPCERSLSFLKAIYRDEVAGLSDQFGMDLGHWISDPMTD